METHEAVTMSVTTQDEMTAARAMMDARDLAERATEALCKLEESVMRGGASLDAQTLDDTALVLTDAARMCREAAARIAA